MDGRKLQFTSPLETALAKIRRQEENLWGRMQSWTHRCLVSLESHPLLRNYKIFVKSHDGVAGLGRKPIIDLDSLFFISLIFHLLLLFLLTRITLPPSLSDTSEPIRIQFFDFGAPAQAKTEKAEKKQAKIAPAKPNTSPPPPKVESKPAASSEKTVPQLPGPKVLAQAPRREMTAPLSESAESLVQLPTKQTESVSASPPAAANPLPAAVGEQGASLPETLRKGENVQTASVGSPGAPAGRNNPDFNAYLKMIEKRVQSLWRLPEGISGNHLVYLSFVLDRAGKLVRVEVVDSTDSRLDSSAIEAMKLASPFPPIPDSIKELAGTEMFMKFPTERIVKGVR